MEPAISVCGPLHKNLLRTAIVLLATCACAQSAPPKYDKSTETKLKGTVEQLKLVPPTGGKQVAYLVLKNGQDTIDVFLCPKSFLDEMGVTFQPSDIIQVTGSKVKQDSADMILAREIEKGGDTITLRFGDGKPAW
jgi:hypothetical protein